jgi:uncharacterized protein (DUF1697 family)
MNTYIAFLRGINISGQKKIIMKDFISLLESKELQNVSYYLQSGNIIFETDIRKDKAKKNQIEKIITNHYGFKVPVLIKEKKDLLDILNKNPYFEKDMKHMYFTLLYKMPNNEIIQKHTFC